MAEIVKEKQATFTSGGEGASVQEELHERREAIEQEREKRERPRKDFLATGKGKASDHFELVTNRETVEGFANQDGAPVSTEELSESAREHWLRTGELPEKKANGKAAAKKEEPPAAKPPERPKMADYKGEDGQIDNDRYEQALDRYEQDKTEFAKQEAAKPKVDAQIDKEIFEEIGKRRDWWNEEGHAEAHKTLPQRIDAAQAALSAEERNIIANSPAMTMPIHAELQGFLGHALARMKNLGHVYLELAKDPGMVQRMNEDWTKTANKPKERWATEQSIRYVLRVIDKQGAGAATVHGPNGAEKKQERQLTRAGKPPAEASGSTSSPADNGSAEAAWRRKDLTQEERGELYRTRKNEEEAAARRKRHPRRSR
jgi:hypothetical protein